MLLQNFPGTQHTAHRGHDGSGDDVGDDAAGGVCWPEASLSVWLAAVLSSAWVWFFAFGGTVSRKLSSSPFDFKVKQRIRVELSKKIGRRSARTELKVAVASSTRKKRRFIGAVVLMGKSFLLLSLTGFI